MNKRVLVTGTYWIAAMTVAATQAVATPVNPQRPFTATNCAHAQERYAEAEAGSPLISAEENEEVRLAARAQMERLCDSGAPETPKKTADE